MNQTEQLTTWLNSAYSMEQSLAQVLENHTKDAKDYPELYGRMQRHLEETRQHAERVKECLALLDEKPSMMKSAMGNIMGMVQGASTGAFRDELIKNVLADYGAEHFEIACYRSLVAAADELGRTDIANICGDILKDEEGMAAWLEEQIPEVTRMVLHQTTTA